MSEKGFSTKLTCGATVSISSKEDTLVPVIKIENKQPGTVMVRNKRGHRASIHLYKDDIKPLINLFRRYLGI